MKKLNFALIFIFTFTFLFLSADVYAEEEVSSNVSKNAGAQIDTPSAESSKSSETKEPSQTDVTTIATATGQGPFIPSEAIQTDTFTGTANMSIPITVVSGRKGIQPNLSISYNSSGGNGWCGVGWLLDLGSIQRSIKYGPPQYNDTDTFIFAQAGSAQELVNIGAGEYRAKTEGAFMKFTYQNGYWIVKDKKGITYYFGVTASARQLNPNNNLTFKWCLEAAKDLTGNYMNIYYVTYDYQIYPEKIAYTGYTTQTLPPFLNEGLFAEVNFVLEDRTDIVSNYSTGGGGTQPIKTTKRLKTIEVKAEDNLVRKYVLDYQQSQRTNRSLVSQVTLWDDNGTASLPPTTFTYQEINDTTYAILTNNITNQGDNLWNVQVDGGDYFDSNEWILYPWGQFSNGQSIYGWSQTYIQASYSDPSRWWTIDAGGNFNYGGVQDTAFHAWTYVYVPNATTITIPWDSDMAFMWLNGSYEGNGQTHTFNLNAGYNLLEITGYNQNDNNYFHLNYALASNVSVMHSYWFAKPQLTGDFNGDGLTDFATFDDYGGIWRVVLSFGSGFFPDQIWLSGMGNSNTTPLVGDFNNDGKSDICSFDKITGNWQFAYSNGQNGFTINTPIFFTNWVNYKPMVGDYNGDGFLDLCGFNPTNGNWYVALSDGEGYFYNAQLWINSFGVGENKLPLGGDFNGDGLTDALYFDKPSGSWYVAFSNGTDAFISSTSNPWATNFGTDKEPIIVDFNVDGLTDIGYLNRENSLLTIMISDGYSAFANQQDWITSFTITSNNTVAQLGDYNGDGLIDPAIFDPFTNDAQVAITNGKVSDLLSSFNNGVGGSSTINYLPSTSMPNYGGDMSNDLPFVTQVVSNVTSSDGLGNQYTTSYYYKDGLYDIQDREFRGFGYAKVTDALGTTNETYFYQDDILKGCSYHEGEIRDTSVNLYQQILNDWNYVQPYPGYNIYFRRLRSKTTYFYNGDTQNYAQFTKQTRSEYDYDDYGNITHIADLGDWDMGTDDKHTYTSYLYNTENHLLCLPNYTYLTDWENNIAKYSWFYYDNHISIEELPTLGNLTKQEDWFKTSTNLSPVPGNTENPKTTFTYDTYGNLLTTTDAIGNTTPEPDDRTTTITYDSDYHLFPLTTTNALNHIISNEYYGINGVPLNDGTYHGLWGQVKSSTDTNNITTFTIYDSFGRAIKTIGPNDTPDLPTTSVEYNLSTTPINIITHSRIEHGEDETLDSITFYDGLGRAIEAKSFSEVENQYIISGQVEFNSRGLPYKKYLPFFDDDYDFYTLVPATHNPLPPAILTYDALGRVIQLTNPDNSYATTSYEDWTTTVIDPNGHMSKSYMDAFGRLVTVEEYTGADGRDPNYPQTQGPVEDYYTLYTTTNYSYDTSNNLVNLVDTIGCTTTITYDSLNRKISMTDPDMGHWTYEYDLVGNLISQTDARTWVIEFTYDDINRLTAKSYPNSTTSSVTYTYDDITIPYSKGRLTKASYANTTEETKFYYNELGQEIQSTKKIDNNEYNIYRTYDALGRLKTLTYPEGEVLTYTYNGQGQIETIKNQDNYFYVQSATYNQNNQITNVVYGNNTSTSYTYNPNTLRLTNLLTQNNQAVPLQNLTYSFDSAGDVISITDSINTNTQYFTYDHLNRLTSANAPNSYGLKEYEYNAIGNILSKEGVGFTYNNLRPHAVTGTTVGPTAFNYDSNGNMVSVVAPTYYVPNSTYQYDAENRLIKAENYDARSRTCFYYDGDGGRTKKYTIQRQDDQFTSTAPLLQQKVWEFLVAINPLSAKEAHAAPADHFTIITSTNIYVGQSYEIVKQTHQLPVAKKYIFFGPNKICSVENGDKYYYHTDHLNSSNVITDNTGAQQKLLQYMPYGGTSVETGTYSTNYRFTGKELDDETGLYFYGARYYNPVIGRFITPDSIVPAPNNPQTLNRYSYVINNPVRYTDPSGHGLFDWLGDLFQSIGNFFSNLWNNIVGPIISAVITVVVIVAIALIPGGQTVAVALASQATWVAATAAAATTATLQTPEGQQFIQRFANEVFDDIFGMSPQAAYTTASIVSYMGLNMAYQFAFAAMLPNARQITDIKEFNPNTDQSIAQDIINNGGGENYGLRPFLDESGNLVMAPNSTYQILCSGDDPVGIIVKGLNIAGGDQHIGIILKGLNTTVDLPSFFGDPLGALSQGYLTFGISHTAVNIDLLNWGSTMTIGNIGGGWTTTVSTFVYGPYGGGLTGAIAFNETNK